MSVFILCNCSLYGFFSYGIIKPEKLQNQVQLMHMLTLSATVFEFLDEASPGMMIKITITFQSSASHANVILSTIFIII